MLLNLVKYMFSILISLWRGVALVVAATSIFVCDDADDTHPLSEQTPMPDFVNIAASCCFLVSLLWRRGARVKFRIYC